MQRELSVSRVSRIVLGVLVTSSSISCTTMPVGFEDRDRYAVSAPIYSDSRIFYACDISDTSPDRPLRRDFEVSKDVADGESSCGGEETQFNNGDDISVLISQVRLDSEDERGLGWNMDGTKKKDVAVVINFDAKAGQPSDPIVVWYERGVAPGRVLSFANLHVYTQSNWDTRVPPYFRLRVIDVTSEKNAEVRAFFEQSSGIYSLINSAMGSSLSAPLLQMVTRAGQLALTGRGNQILLDYTFQLYPAGQMGNIKGTTLPPFYSGTYFLTGRNQETAVGVWKKKFSLNEWTGQLQADDAPYPAPYVKVVAMRANYTVLGIVEERSKFLNALLRESGRKDRAMAVESARLLYSSVQLYAAVEAAIQQKNMQGLIALVEFGKTLSSDTSSQMEILRMVGDLNRVPCSFATLDAAKQFLEKNKGTDLEFDSGKLRVKGADLNCQ